MSSRDKTSPGSGIRGPGSGGSPGGDERGGQRLQKIISQAGVASRRAAEKLIAEGRVTINGQTVSAMGTKADPARDDIRVDGRRVKSAARPRYILLYKPPGFVTTRSDPERRRTVIDLLSGVKEYVYPVGRLDYDTEGLLLLTNDGDLAAQLTHPSHGVERTYEAHVAGMPDDEALDRLRHGIPLDGRRTLPAEVSLLNRGLRDRQGVLSITIREGRNRQVRRMCEAVGHPVRKLIRVGIGPLSDRGLRPGTWRELTAQELRVLKQTAAWVAPKPGKQEALKPAKKQAPKPSKGTARTARRAAASRRPASAR